jgi:hypothetical protein
MSTTQKGKPWVFKGLYSQEWVRGQGVTEYGQLYEALDQIQAGGLFQTLQERNDRVRIERQGDGPSFRVIAIRNRDEDENPEYNIVDTHELLDNVLQQSYAVNTRLHTLLTDAQIARVVSLSKAVKKGDKTHAEAYTEIGTFTTGTADGTARDLLDDLIQDNTSFVTTQWVYRRTVNIGPGIAYDANYVNKMKVYPSTSDLLVGEGITLPSDFRTLPEGEWLKASVQKTKQYGQRTQVVYEYWHADVWSDWRYETATTG